MPLYARHGVSHLWLVDPQYRTLGMLQAYKLDRESGHWIWLGGYGKDERIRAEPFAGMELHFGVVFQKLAVLATKGCGVGKSEIVSRLQKMLEAASARPKPQDDST